MIKFYLFLSLATISVPLVFLLGNDQIITYIATIIFFISTVAITFTLVNLREERELEEVSTPQRYYQRRGSFNWPNYIRSGILVIAGLLFTTNTLDHWRWILIILWLINCGTVVYPLWQIKKVSQQLPYDLIFLGLQHNFTQYLTDEQLVNIISELNSGKTPSMVNWYNLNSDQRQKFVAKWRQLIEEMNL